MNYFIIVKFFCVVWLPQEIISSYATVTMGEIGDTNGIS